MGFFACSFFTLIFAILQIFVLSWPFVHDFIRNVRKVSSNQPSEQNIIIMINDHWRAYSQTELNFFSNFIFLILSSKMLN